MKAKPVASITRFPARRPTQGLLRDYWRAAESLNGRAFDMAAIAAAAEAERARDDKAA